MKNQFFLFLLIIIITIKFSLANYYPIEKYSSKEIEIQEKKYNFSLNIKDFKIGETIYLKIKCEIKIKEKDIIYYWSQDNFQNIKNVSLNSSKNSCSRFTSHYSLGSKSIYINYCYVNKELDYNSLIIQIETYYRGNLTITNTKYNTISLILIIVFSSLFFLFILIMVIIIICRKKNRYDVKAINLSDYMKKW